MNRAQWTLLVLLMLSIFLNYIDRSNLSLAAPLIEKEYSLTSAGTGKLLGAFFWTYALLQLFGISGWFADRFAVSRVLAGGLLLWSVATIVTGLVTGFAAMFAMRMVVGAGESLAYPCYSRIFATDIPSEQRGRANALLDAASKLGPAIGTLVGGTLLIATGWRVFFVVLGAASLLWLAPWMWFTRGSAAKRVESKPGGPGTLDILEQRSAWGAFLGHFCGNYVWFFLLTWLPEYFVKSRGFAMAEMVNVTTIAYVAIAAATVTAGWISDRLIARGAAVTRVRKMVVVCGLMASTLILPVAAIENRDLSLALLLAGCMGFGVYTSNHWAITQTLAGPLAAGRWTSLQNGIGNLSGVAAAWLTGIAVERTHSFALPFALAGMFALAGAAMWGIVVGPVDQVQWGKKALV